MENTEKILLAITLIVAAFAVYIAYTTNLAKAMPQSPDQSISIILQGMNLGLTSTDYSYSFSQSSNGYNTIYKTEKSGNLSMLIIDNPLSEQSAYFLDNDTILCITYGGAPICSLASSNKDLIGYASSLKLVFLNPDNIRKNIDDFNYLMRNNYVQINPQVGTGILGNTPCAQVNYTVDYTNISVNDAARFEISATSPKLFNVSFCLVNQTGQYIRSINYTLDNAPQYSSYEVLGFNTTGLNKIVPPTNLSGDFLSALLNERQDERSLITCYMNQSDKDRCISTLALGLKNRNLCTFTGQRQDRCLVSLVSLTKDTSLCTSVIDPSFKDDCYVELAGAYKDNSFCSNVVNSTKIPVCMNASSIIAPMPANVTTNVTANQSKGGK